MDPQNQTTIAQSKSPVRVTAWVLIRLLDGIALLILFLALTPVGWLAVGLARDFGISKPVAIVGGILIAVGGFSWLLRDKWLGNIAHKLQIPRYPLSLSQQERTLTQKVVTVIDTLMATAAFLIVVMGVLWSFVVAFRMSEHGDLTGFVLLLPLVWVVVRWRFIRRLIFKDLN